MRAARLFHWFALAIFAASILVAAEEPVQKQTTPAVNTTKNNAIEPGVVEKGKVDYHDQSHFVSENRNGAPDPKQAGPLVDRKKLVQIVKDDLNDTDSSSCTLGNPQTTISHISYTLTVIYDINEKTGQMKAYENEEVEHAKIKFSTSLCETTMKNTCQSVIGKTGTDCAKQKINAKVTKKSKPNHPVQKRDEESGDYDVEIFSNERRTRRDLGNSESTPNNASHAEITHGEIHNDMFCHEVVKKKVTPDDQKSYHVKVLPSGGKTRRSNVVIKQEGNYLKHSIHEEGKETPDVTYTHLDKNMTSLFAEYNCYNCPGGTAKHLFVMENVVIHVDAAHVQSELENSLACKNSAKSAPLVKSNDPSHKQNLDVSIYKMKHIFLGNINLLHLNNSQTYSATGERFRNLTASREKTTTPLKGTPSDGKAHSQVGDGSENKGNLPKDGKKHVQGANGDKETSTEENKSNEHEGLFDSDL